MKRRKRFRSGDFPNIRDGFKLLLGQIQVSYEYTETQNILIIERKVIVLCLQNICTFLSDRYTYLLSVSIDVKSMYQASYSPAINFQ